LIRIVIVDDHAIVRQGLARILEKSGTMQVVAAHENALDMLEWLRVNDCDVALIDISMPGMNGIDLLKQLKSKKPNLPVLVVSIYSEAQYAVRLIKAGACGYLSKGCQPSILLEAVNLVASGHKYLSPEVSEMLAKEVNVKNQKVLHETLSDREYQILLLLASAQTVGEIAANLCLSGKTISTYRSRILEKMQLRNNAELMHYVIENNLALA
jgi:two-component system, NarL family, invasion response regulator UvrY